MLYFSNDYSEGTHEAILQRLIETNREQLPGYGTDYYCELAKQKIKRDIQCENAEVYFLSGGTQTNKIVIASMLAPYEGVIAANTGHISLHEAGAIENTGHKVLELPHDMGKIKADTLKDYMCSFYADANHSHMVFPGMVYISFPTEYGTLYSKQELEELYDICKEYKLPLFIDGARLGYGLASDACDLDIAELANFCDVFYIGGTKVGAFCGEAVVFTKNNCPKHFMTTIKSHGGLLAKGRLLGIQFDALFSDNLYFEISKEAIRTAEVLKKGLKEKGYTFLLESPTNQIFIILENSKLDSLSQNVKYSFWEKYDSTHSVIRFATSWATSSENVRKLLELL